MDSDPEDWTGETMEANVTQDTWVKVNKLWAAEIGAEIVFESPVFEADGTET